MNKPKIYEGINHLHRRDVKEFLHNYKHLIQWRSDGKDSMLDIGCGPGNITHNYLIPLLPSTFTKLVGFDITSETIAYANNNYKHPKLSYRLCNIEDDNNINKNEYFDHILSFFTLHWMKNLPNAVRNIYKMLETNGDCLLVFVGKCNVNGGIYKASIDPKWSKYMPSPDTPNFISCYYHFNDDRINDFTMLLRSAGFSDYKIDTFDRTYNYIGYENIKNFATVVNPLVDRLPEDLKDDYTHDVIKSTFPNGNYEQDDFIYVLEYSIIIVYARK